MTAKIAPLDMLDFVELGDPLSASEYNTLIQQVKARSVLSHPGYESPTGERVEKATPFFYPPVHGYASDADIPVYSVCSIDTGVTALKFIEGYPQTNVKAYVDGGFEFTNGGIYVKKDDPLYLQPIGFDTPIVLTYTGTAPIAGDEVGPADAAFTVSKAGAGYVVINAPDTTNKLLWAIRVAFSTPVHFGKLTGDITHGLTGTFTKYTNASTTGDSLTVLNLTGETLKQDVWMKAWTPGGWTDDPLCEPYELDDCPLV